MDKYEYNLKLEQLKSLSSEGKYEEAADIADTINWNKVRNVNALVKVSDIYEKAERYEDSRDVLLLAYERSPLGRMIIYHLAEIALKMDELDEAQEYCDEFIRIAPHDNLKYVISYDIRKAQGASTEELIEILEEFKEHEYQEEWAYELAMLYSESGQDEKCVAACDELILWFGEGVFVEQAMELKMKYAPLSKSQEEKYRKFKMKQEGITEIEPETMIRAGEYGHDAVAIPEVNVNVAEKFSTLNLQAEIARGIQKIMEAKKQGDLDEAMDDIQKVVEEFPYVQIERNPETEDEKADPMMEKQITGQMSIMDILGDWDQEEASQEDLESEKAKALQKAESIMESLQEMEEDTLKEAVSSEDTLEENTLEEDTLEEDTLEEDTLEEDTLEEDTSEENTLEKNTLEEDVSEEVMEEDTSEEVEGEAMVEELYGADPVKEEDDNLDIDLSEELLASAVADIVNSAAEEADDVDPAEEAIIDVDAVIAGIVEAEEAEAKEAAEEAENVAGIEEAIAEAAEDAEETEEAAETEEAVEDPAEDDSSEEEAKKKEAAEAIAMVEEDTVEKEEIISEPTIPMPDLKEALNAAAAQRAIEKEIEKIPLNRKDSLSALTPDMRYAFAYFIPIRGMEDQILDAVNDISERLTSMNAATYGNLVVTGEPGCGKTVLATTMIRVLQQYCGRPVGKVGKISAKALNNKDIQALTRKVAGGCLIVENAGELNHRSIATLSYLMETDRTGLLVVLEDSARAIRKLMAMDDLFSRKFTSRISIPIFTNDELVAFARSYSKEKGYKIDDMAVLALYNRISNIQKLDQATTLGEVKEIVDAAIAKEAKWSLHKYFSILTAKRYTDDDRIVLSEKNFSDK